MFKRCFEVASLGGYEIQHGLANGACGTFVFEFRVKDGLESESHFSFTSDVVAVVNDATGV